MVRIDENLTIPDEELEFRVSTSRGPGGQNVNRVRSRVTLRFDVERSARLDAAQKQVLAERLSSRISKEGVFQVSSERHRTQAANREAAEHRMGELIREALEDRPVRKQTRVPKGARRRRLEEKKRQSERKRGRSRPHDLD